MIKYLKAAALAMLLTASAGAQTLVQKEFLTDFNLNSTTLQYCAVTQDAQSGPLGPVTANSTTTVTAVGAGSPFTNLVVGDTITLTTTGGTETRTITIRNSATSVVVSGAAITVTDVTNGVPFYWKHQSCGNGINSGQFDMSTYSSWSISVEVRQLNTTSGIDFELECKGTKGGGWEQLSPSLAYPAAGPTYPVTPLTAVQTFSYNGTRPVASCRVGMKMNSTDDGTDTGALAERIFIRVAGARNN